MTFDIELFGCFISDIKPTINTRVWGQIDVTLPDSVFRANATLPRPLGRASTGKEERKPRHNTNVLPPGTVIDRFKIERVIGIGGFSVVYRAKHQLLDTVVALKLMKSEVLTARPTMGALLVEEARLVARIQHPNVVKIFDVISTKELTYIVMEYIEGVSLSQKLALSGPFNAQEVLNIGLGVASGLAAAFEQGLIHRDIKSANVLLTKDATARIVDFGFAQTFGSDERTPRIPANAIIGTFGYIAPEQINGQTRPDFRSDIYSLGVTLEEASRGLSFWRKNTQSPPPDNAQQLPEPLTKLLKWMQASEPNQRPGSYSILLDAMKATLSKISG
jgi:serine/threonine protein kinase